jgi:hypothetical protein
MPEDVTRIAPPWTESLPCLIASRKRRTSRKKKRLPCIKVASKFARPLAELTQSNLPDCEVEVEATLADLFEE